MRSFLLKAVATVLTLAATGFSAAHVSGNVKNAAAPLHPSVLGRPAAGGAETLTLTPGVRAAADVTPVTSTYAS